MNRQSYESIKDYEEGWTNDVLIHNERNKKKYFFIPTYARTKLTNIVSLDLKRMIGQLNLIITVTFYYGQLEETYPEVLDVLQSKVELGFKMDQEITLNAGILTYGAKDLDGQLSTHVSFIQKFVDRKQKLITFYLKKKISVPLSIEIFWSPFQYIEYPATLMFQRKQFTSQQTGQKFIVCFNLMGINQEKRDPTLLIGYTSEGVLGQYDLGQRYLSVDLSNFRFYQGDNSVKTQVQAHAYEQYAGRLNFENQSKQKKISEELVESFQYGHFVYPVYRKAIAPLVQMFVPLVLLGMMTLGLFFAKRKVSKRMINIATILISYIAFLPFLRKHLPPASKLVISEIFFFLMGSGTLFVFADTIVNRNHLDNQKLSWHKNHYFLMALLLIGGIMSILIIVTILYILFHHKIYDLHGDKPPAVFDRSQWINKKCDKFFNMLNQNQYSVQPLYYYNMKYPSYPAEQSDKQQKPQQPNTKIVKSVTGFKKLSKRKGKRGRKRQRRVQLHEQIEDNGQTVFQQDVHQIDFVMLI